MNLSGGIHGDTMLKSVQGNDISIKSFLESETDDIWIYGSDNSGNIVPVMAKKPQITKYVSELVVLIFMDGSFRCTLNHPILCADGNYRNASEIERGAYVKTGRWKSDSQNNIPYKVLGKKVIRLKDMEPMYGIEVNNYHSFLVVLGDKNEYGIIVHD